MKNIWIEYLRILTVIAVTAIHESPETFLNFSQIQLHDWWFANFINVSSRFAEPIFIML